MFDKTKRFVQMVEAYPCLYNNTLPEYARKDLTDRAWAEISRRIRWPIADCKEKWRNVRNNFVRSLKPHRTSERTKKKYYLHDHMQFVIEFLRPQLQQVDEHEGNAIADDYDAPLEFENVQIVANDSSDTAMTSAPRKMRKTSRRNRHSANVTDTDFENTMTEWTVKIPAIEDKNDHHNTRSLLSETELENTTIEWKVQPEMDRNDDIYSNESMLNGAELGNTILEWQIQPVTETQSTIESTEHRVLSNTVLENSTTEWKHKPLIERKSDIHSSCRVLSGSERDNTAAKSKLTPAVEKRNDAENGRRMFLLSLLPELEQLNPSNYSKFRINALIQLQSMLSDQAEAAEMS